VSLDVVLDLPQTEAAMAADPIRGQHPRLDKAVDRALADVQIERDAALRQQRLRRRVGDLERPEPPECCPTAPDAEGRADGPQVTAWSPFFF
jgi:hypothetical protein